MVFGYLPQLRVGSGTFLCFQMVAVRIIGPIPSPQLLIIDATITRRI